ncbi:tetratricopeptide repeat protein [Kordia sp. YSTF-M3]|uniref:Tetratricopeptide repeat protein n=1 Tax=Kordia aestuariivivens TaxID=2759037 RepID=A0ABR7Q8U5_9FLAO|nr:tetratricopeptide repeat protein [Kordia aestuariivivens]MBC8754985.1 tetratricopeptide repeat protein [Kordia aestuariivivens]
MSRKAPTPSTVKLLYGLSNNTCSNPTCKNPIIKDGVPLGEICHIEAASENGPRYNKNSDDEYRRSFENLILLCEACHKIIDIKIEAYPTSLLTQWKDQQESKSNEFEINTELLELLISKFREQHNYYNQGSGTQIIINPSIHIERKINKVEKGESDNIFLFQYIDTAGNHTEERKSFEEFLKPFIKDKEAQIKILRKSLSDKEKIEGLLDEKVLKLSNEIIKIEEEKQQLETHVKHFLTELEGKNLSETTTLYREAFELFIAGKIKDALAVLDDANLEVAEQKAIESIKQTAETRILKAQILRVDHKYKEASENYEKAVSLYGSWDNCLEAADYFYFIHKYQKSYDYYQQCLQKAGNNEQKASTLNNLGNLQNKINEFKKAEEVYTAALNIYRKLATNNPKKYLTDLAMVLNNFGTLLHNMNEFEKAEKAYVEGLKIRRELAKSDPQTFLPKIAIILNNLGVLQKDTNEFEKAKKVYAEALEIRRKLAKKKPQVYLPDVAMTLNNLAILQKESNEFENAEKVYLEALEIRRELAKKNPQTYLPDVADTLNNLGNLQRIQSKFKNAEIVLNEALDIYKELAEYNPQAYLPNVAMALNNLGILQRVINEFKKSEKVYEEALHIRKELANHNPQIYLPDVAGTLNGLAILQEVKNEFDKAENAHLEALSIRKELAKDNPQTYIPDLAITKINLGIFYQDSKINKEKSIQFTDEAVSHLLPFKEIPYIQNYLEAAFTTLRKWDINVEEYWQNKLKEAEE